MVDLSTLTDAQLAGICCVVCGETSGPMVRVSLIAGCETIACAGECERKAQ